jgi:hypothetical protein
VRFRATARKDVGCIVDGPAVATMQAIVRPEERRYARAHAVSSKWSGSTTRRAGSDADRQEGQITNTSRMPARTRLECEGGRHADNRAATSSTHALSLSTRRAENREGADARSSTSALSGARHAVHARCASIERAASVAPCASAIAMSVDGGGREAQRGWVRSARRRRAGAIWALSAKRRPVANTAHDVSVRGDQAQGATHAVTALPLALRAGPDSGGVFAAQSAAFAWTPAATRQDLRPGSAKDPGGVERGRDEVRLELDVNAPRSRRVGGDVTRSRGRGRTVGARQSSA